MKGGATQQGLMSASLLEKARNLELQNRLEPSSEIRFYANVPVRDRQIHKKQHMAVYLLTMGETFELLTAGHCFPRRQTFHVMLGVPPHVCESIQWELKDQNNLKCVSIWNQCHRYSFQYHQYGEKIDRQHFPFLSPI
jgi:hypothetical protein